MEFYKKEKIIYATLKYAFENSSSHAKLEDIVQDVEKYVPENMKDATEELKNLVRTLEDDNLDSEKRNLIRGLLEALSNPILHERITPTNPYILAVFLQHYILEKGNDNDLGLSLFSMLKDIFASGRQDVLLETLKLEEDLPKMDSQNQEDIKRILNKIPIGHSTVALNYDELLKYRNDLSAEVIDIEERIKKALSFVSYVKMEVNCV